MSIPAFPDRTDLRGIGLSDDWRYAEKLPSKLSYENTFYHREPRLDLTDPPEDLFGTLDFLIASDVLEHVAPPVERAFGNAFRLLKPAGVFILTVPDPPDTSTQQTREHFPELNEYEIFDFNGRPILVNRTARGDWEVFDDLTFHGGHGSALEMRVFSRSSLLRQLRAAGFDDIEEWTAARPEWGILWGNVHGFPIVARRSPR